MKKTLPQDAWEFALYEDLNLIEIKITPNYNLLRGAYLVSWVKQNNDRTIPVLILR